MAFCIDIGQETYKEIGVIDNMMRFVYNFLSSLNLNSIDFVSISSEKYFFMNWTKPSKNISQFQYL